MKKIVLRSLIGASVGLTISTFITIIISVCMGSGEYYPVEPELIGVCKSEINAVILQSVCSILYGAVWAGASFIWEKESWSLLRQTVTHLILCSAATLPTAYFMRWMPRSFMGLALYFGIFFAVYLSIWLSRYFYIKKSIERINKRMQAKNRG